jgi:hypothetical protein
VPKLPEFLLNLPAGERKFLRNSGIFVGGFLLICLIVQLWNGTGEKVVDAEVPVVPVSNLESQENFVFRPRFRAKDGEFSAGTAFVATSSFSKKPFLITALHLIGPAGGYYEQARSESLRQTINGLSVREMFTDQVVSDFAVSALEIIDAAPLGVDSIAGDVAVFRLETSDTELIPAKLADGNSPVTVGDTLHLVYAVPGKETRIHKVTVSEERDGLLVYFFEDKEISLRGAGGAPLLNAKGEVAAVHLGNGKETEQVFGIANPVSRFRSRLELANRAPLQVSVEASAATAKAD